MPADRHSSSLRLWRAHELLGAASVVAFACFHLWEQWTAFAGREAFVHRLASTSHGPLGWGVEWLAAIVPAIAWTALEIHLRWRCSEPEDLRLAMAEDAALAKRLGILARAGSWVFFGWLFYHVSWLWLPKLSMGFDPVVSWAQLRDGLGAWPHAALHAVGLTAFTVHVWAAGPRLAIVMGWARSAPNRRASRLSALIVAVGLALLYAQLAGWHAAGAGTVWPLTF